MLNNNVFLIEDNGKCVLNIYCYPFFGEWFSTPNFKISPSPANADYEKNLHLLYRICEVAMPKFERRLAISKLKISVRQIYGGSPKIPDLPIFKNTNEEEQTVLWLAKANQIEIVWYDKERQKAFEKWYEQGVKENTAI